MHSPPVPHPTPEGTDGVHATASVPQAQGATGDASAAQLPPLAANPPSVAPGPIAPQVVV